MNDWDSITLGSFGSFAVGKTAITVQYIKHEFVAVHDPTLEDYFEVKRKFGGDDKVTNLTIYDTAGNEEFTSLVPQYMRNAEGILLVYSITDKESFEKIRDIHKRIVQTKECDVSEIPVVLVGNKCDLEKQRKVTTEEGKNFAVELGDVPFFETSAKTRTNIEEAWTKLVEEVRRIRKLKSPQNEAPQPEPVVTQNQPTSTASEKKSKCSLQ